MSEIHIHAGLHKTGTTALQRVFADSESKLLDLDILYPNLSWPQKDSWNGNSSVMLQSAFSSRTHYIISRDGLNNKPSLKEIKRLLQLEARPPVTIMSGEAISAFTLEELIGLREFLRGECKYNQVYIYLVVREYYAFLCSDIQQRIKMGYPCLGDLLAKTYVLPRLSDRIANITTAFSGDSIIFMDYERSRTSNGIVNLFLESFNQVSSIKIDAEDLAESSKSFNKSLGNITCRIIDIYNESKPISAIGSRPAETLGLSSLRKLEQQIPNQQSFCLDSREYAQCIEHIKSQNSLILGETSFDYSDIVHNTSSTISRQELYCHLLEGFLRGFSNKKKG